MDTKLYFGHPINVYGTDLERFLLQRIARALIGGDSIENPADKAHEAGYEEWKKKSGNGMDYFFQTVLPTCSGGVFLPFRDGKFGAGVYDEALFLSRLLRPIHQITPEGVITPLRLDESLRLGIQETRSRIRTPDGALAPY